LRPAIGGLLLGALLLVLPEMYGVGYPVLGNGIAGKYAIGFLLVLLVGKMVATSLTIGIGGSGGVFAPSLFIGAMLGAAYGEILTHAAPGIAGPAGAYALIGMGAVFAGSARAPITAVVILFELTGEYSIILPLMTAIVLATGVSHLISRDTIYTHKLRRRGVDLDQSAAAELPFVTGTAADVMEPVGAFVPQSTTLLEVADALARAPHGQLPVLDDQGRYRGVITARAVADALADGTHDQALVGDHVDLPQTVRADHHLGDALDVLETADGGVPVLDPEGAQVVGWLSHQAVLTSLRPARPRLATAAPGREVAAKGENAS
ncbi:MAG: chloride channel protein, partial [Lapillicoccus sp.]